MSAEGVDYYLLYQGLEQVAEQKRQDLLRDFGQIRFTRGQVEGVLKNFLFFNEQGKIDEVISSCVETGVLQEVGEGEYGVTMERMLQYFNSLLKRVYKVDPPPEPNGESPGETEQIA